MLTGPAPRSSLLAQRLERARHYITWARWRLGLSVGLSTPAPEDHMVYLENELKAARGSASASMKKTVAQGKELTDLQAAHTRLRSNLTKVQEERDELKAIMAEIAPATHAHWLRAKKLAEAKAARATDIPQTHETHGD